jgi:hypothetical protein
VHVRRGDQHLRLIVECRHLFGKQGTKKLGLPAVCDFASVQRQLQADQAWMLTTVGYTNPAAGFAGEEGIRLGVLSALPRPPLSRIDFHGTVAAPGDLRIVEWQIADDAERHRVRPLLETQGPVAEPGLENAHDVCFVNADGTADASFFEVLDPVYARIQRDLVDGTNRGEAPLDHPRYLLVGRVPVKVKGFKWEVDLFTAPWDFSIDFAHRIARLVLRMLDAPGDERFTLSELAVWDIDADGRLHRRSG